MAGRIRTTKKLAQRIDRNYFQRMFPLVYWRRVGWIVLTAVGLLWVGWSLLSGKQAFNAGPLATAHKIAINDCKSCHLESAVWGTKVSDKACLTCHDGPKHQVRQIDDDVPTCASCHVDHKGSPRLAAVSDKSCVACHSDLRVTGGPHKFAEHIKSLTDGHPEITAVRDGHPPDPGTIKLNHKVHLKKDLRGPEGKLVQMVCADCHHMAMPADRDKNTMVTTASLFESLPPSASPMIPPSPYLRSLSPEIEPSIFERDCMSCHPLQFDPRFKDAPHKDGKTVHDYVTKQYTDYIASHPDAIHETSIPALTASIPSPAVDPGLPNQQTKPLPPPRNAAEWVSQRVTEAELLLFQKDCKECHSVTYSAPTAPPDVPKANQTIRWMRDSRFDHKSHQLVDCAECHKDAKQSERTSDVLLPKLATCEKCHTGGSDGAASGCYECHIYHDWSKGQPVKSTRMISQLMH